MQALQDRDHIVRLRAAETLGTIGPDASAAIAALGTALDDADPQDRRIAAVALGCIGPDAETAVPRLVALLADRDNNVRKLDRVGPEPHRRRGRPHGAGPGRGAGRPRSDACAVGRLALGCIGPPAREAVPAFVQILKRAERYVQDEAAWALGRIGPAAALPCRR